MPEGDGVTHVPTSSPQESAEEPSSEETSLQPPQLQESADMTPDQVHGQLTAQLMQSGVIAQNNFITVQKVIDYDYLENKRMVTLDEAVGVREVQAKETPGGPANANRTT